MKKFLYLLLILICISGAYSQDRGLFNKISGSYQVKQRIKQRGNPEIGIAKDDPNTMITITVERPHKLQFSSIDEIWTYIPLPLPSFSQPKNLCFVLDMSSSMAQIIKAGSSKKKIDWVKETCLLLFDEKEAIIGAGDFISVVTFSDPDQVEEIISPRQIQNSGDRQDCIDKIIALKPPKGNTYIYNGLAKGYDLVKGNPTEGYINRVLLLTDGEASDSKEGIKNLVKQYCEEGIGTASTIALSKAADKPFMDQLAGLGGGLSIFVDDYEAFKDPSKFHAIVSSNREEIQKAIDALFDTAAWEVDLTLSLTKGVSVTKEPKEVKGILPKITCRGDNEISEISYCGLSLSYSDAAAEYVSVVIYVSLDGEAVTKNRDKILQLSIRNRDRNRQFPEFIFNPNPKKAYFLSLNHEIQRNEPWILVSDQF